MKRLITVAALAAAFTLAGCTPHEAVKPANTITLSVGASGAPGADADLKKVADAPTAIADLQCTAMRGQCCALVELHRPDEATKAYRGCLKLKPGGPKSLGELGYIKDLRAKLH